MKYNSIANTTIQAPELTLGTMTFGGQTNHSESLAIMDMAFDHGMTLFDTANIYNEGESERIVGQWLKSRRDQVLLASKVGYPMGGQLKGVQLGQSAILEAFDASLKRLGTDYLDIYYLHAPDYHTPIEESLETMSELIHSGKVRYLGVSNFAAWQLADLLAACEKHGFVPPIITQNVYNAITRTLEPELIPFLNEHEMALTVYNPIAAGLLTGKHTADAPAAGSRLADNPVYNTRYWSDANWQSTVKLHNLAKENNLSILELAMKFCQSNPKVTTILTGVSKRSQLEQNLMSIEGQPLSEEVLMACDLIWKEHTGNPFGYNR